MDRIVNLKGTKGIIVKVRCRDRDGRSVHKNQFSIDDKKATERELRVWKDKLGVPIKSFRNIVKDPIDKEELENIRSMMQNSINSTNDKTKKALSV